MLQIIKYRMKCKLRNRTMIFWSLAFPLILTTLFGTVLTSAFHTQTFETIKIAIVNNAYYQQDNVLQETLKQSKNGKQIFFNVRTVDEEEAKTMLKNKDITAYIVDGEQIQVNVTANGLNQTITQMFFDEYMQHSTMIKTMISDGLSMADIQQAFSKTTSYIKENTSKDNNAYSVSFYTILAMNALMGGHWAILSMYEFQANLSSKAQRIGVAPTHQAINLLLDMILNVIIQTSFLIIILAYMTMVINVSFGSSLLPVFLLLVVGSIAGIGFGMIIGNLGRKLSRNAKEGLLSASTMICSVFAGMMSLDIKYIIQVYVPILGYINPVNMITDGLYAIYFYGTGNRFYQNLIYLIVFIVLCYGISYFSIRKKSYDSLEVK